MKDKKKTLDERAEAAKDWVKKEIDRSKMSKEDAEAKWKIFDDLQQSITNGIRDLVLPPMDSNMSAGEKYEHIVIASSAQLSAVEHTIVLLAKLGVISKEHALEALKSAHDLDREIAVALIMNASLTGAPGEVTTEALANFDASKATKQ